MSEPKRYDVTSDMKIPRADGRADCMSMSTTDGLVQTSRRPRFLS